jgi:hypothetical protein
MELKELYERYGYLMLQSESLNNQIMELKRAIVNIEQEKQKAVSKEIKVSETKKVKLSKSEKNEEKINEILLNLNSLKPTNEGQYRLFYCFLLLVDFEIFQSTLPFLRRILHRRELNVKEEPLLSFHRWVVLHLFDNFRKG